MGRGERGEVACSQAPTDSVQLSVIHNGKLGGGLVGEKDGMKLPQHPPLSPLSFLHPPSSCLVSKCSKCKGDNGGNTPLLLVLQQSGMGPVLKHAYNLQEQTNQPIIH